MWHNAITDEIREAACLYALGSLPPEEARRFEEHLATGCPLCGEETRFFQETTALLPAAVARPAPPGLKDRLFERLAPAPPGLHVTWKGEAAWKPIAEGVFLRRLLAERADGETAFLVRMQPGAKFPEHPHPKVEHCYVLEGDIRSGRLVMRSGDYQVADQSSTHAPTWTENGCLLLIVESHR
ncbi:MAG: cupin domain-containing protein [Acidobacteria bacterium]|nr:cupin domain-containing protein [Acidobacteriota bacterium]